MFPLIAKKRSEGYILIASLVFLHIMLWLSITALSTLAELKHLNYQLKNRYQDIQMTKRWINNLSGILEIDAKICNSSPTLYGHKLDWWKQHACEAIDDTMQYYYVVEDKGSDGCAKISGSADIAHYYRLTVRASHLNDPSAHYLLQASLIFPNQIIPTQRNLISDCQENSHKVNIGIQVVRELSE